MVAFVEIYATTEWLIAQFYQIINKGACSQSSNGFIEHHTCLPSSGMIVHFGNYYIRMYFTHTVFTFTVSFDRQTIIECNDVHIHYHTCIHTCTCTCMDVHVHVYMYMDVCAQACFWFLPGKKWGGGSGRWGHLRSMWLSFQSYFLLQCEKCYWPVIYWALVLRIRIVLYFTA